MQPPEFLTSNEDISVLTIGVGIYVLRELSKAVIYFLKKDERKGEDFEKKVYDELKELINKIGRLSTELALNIRDQKHIAQRSTANFENIKNNREEILILRDKVHELGGKIAARAEHNSDRIKEIEARLK
tara:strand:- start:13591 stop:13980 length:390 start_codon:yes stop_codon:yes gene_type:complete